MKARVKVVGYKRNIPQRLFVTRATVYSSIMKVRRSRDSLPEPERLLLVFPEGSRTLLHDRCVVMFFYIDYAVYVDKLTEKINTFILVAYMTPGSQTSRRTSRCLNNLSEIVFF